MEFCELLNECEPNPASLICAASHVLHAMEALEQPRHFVLRDPNSGVANAKLRTIGRSAERDFNLTFEGELESIRDEVENNFLPHLAIHIDRLGKRGAIDVKPEAGPFCGR